MVPLKNKQVYFAGTEGLEYNTMNQFDFNDLLSHDNISYNKNASIVKIFLVRYFTSC